MLFCMSGSDRQGRITDIRCINRLMHISSSQLLKDISAVKKSHSAATVCILTLEESLASKKVNIWKLCGAWEFLFLSAYVLPHAHKHARLLYIWVKSLKISILSQSDAEKYGAAPVFLLVFSDSVHMWLKCSFKENNKGLHELFKNDLILFHCIIS